MTGMELAHNLWVFMSLPVLAVLVVRSLIPRFRSKWWESPLIFAIVFVGGVIDGSMFWAAFAAFGLGLNLGVLAVSRSSR